MDYYTGLSLSQQIQKITLPQCLEHKAALNTICLHRGCQKFLQAECHYCFEKHQDHQSVVASKNLNNLLYQIEILSQNKQQDNLESQHQLKNQFSELVKHLKILSDQCLKTSENLAKLAEKLFSKNNQESNSLQEFLKNILNISKQSEQNQIQSFQKELQRINNIININDPKQIKIIESNQQSPIYNSFLASFNLNISELNKLITQIDKDSLKDADDFLIQAQQSNQDLVQNSTLLTPESLQMIKGWFNRDIKLNLIYQATRDGFQSAKFHELCDNKGATLNLIKSAENDNIFGGYANSPWTSRMHAQKDFKDDGPSFGIGSDIRISNNSHVNQDSYSNFNSSYECPVPNQGKFYLAGKYKFKTSEIEVFTLQ